MPKFISGQATVDDLIRVFYYAHKTELEKGRQDSCARNHYPVGGYDGRESYARQVERH
jgi:hypothetical protein